MQDASERQQEREFRAADGRGSAGEPVKEAVQARQGVGSGRILTVLTVGIVLVAIGLAATYMGVV
ncbi:hypothetical protein [Azorhizobium sp. AG788]|uniref:hypothetical protein n=1 Tax=Azorhizobium sp. AG788 TaxID=2183897 RepID=UPI00313A3E4F